VKRSRAALAAARGDLAGSEALHRDVLRLRRQLGDARGMLDELEELALLAGQQMRLVDAASLLGSLQLGRTETGFAVPGARRAAVDALAVRVAGAPDPAVPVAFTAGTQIALADAVGAALGEAAMPVADTVVTVTRAAHDQDVLTHARDAWYDALGGRLTAQHGDNAGMTLCGRYSGAFPTAYWTTRSTDEAALDIARIEARGDGLVASLRRVPSTGDLFQLHLIDVDKVALADALPILEHMGLRVLDEHPYAIERTGAPVWFYDITLTCHGTLAADEALALERFEQAFVRVWTGSLEDDGFNQLVLSAALSTHDVTILRAYARYLRQTGNAFSLAHIERAVSSHPDVAQALVDLFRARFDPDGPPADDEGQVALAQVVTSAIDAVKALDEDRILRSMLRLVQATQRTTAYLPRADGGVLVGFKLATGSLPELAKPRPMFEIFVYSPWMEGVHLRGGRVARGGIRWSERDDYRTEVHGLMKAQSVKNAVIVPVGAKGGFVVRRPARDAKDAPAEVRRCYADFIGCLLDLTDNVVRGEVQPPPMVRYDEDDPYLVVAADKGTATFSDQANAISAERGFWLGDAFASGGRAGYDHKALAITARGAWESVRRHFWRVGVDPERDDITVVAIGDMSGDVCGNGLLRSSRIRLVGAFDHRHVFLDPDPDADATFIERQRLFKLERSSWDDFDRDLLSPGGGVFPRDAKSISLSPQCRALLDVAEETLTPDEVIRAMLKASVDLLWNGGIGTFVKSSAESDADAGDRSSDAIRVDAADLRCRVVGEGGNLGFTQLARVEYASGGGLINTDAIDNSAGVDCSDHEVNIKILLDQAIVAGALPPSEREELLAAMAGDVCSSVLLNNTLQADALARYVTDADASGRMHLLLMQDLERSGHIDRAVERLPGDKDMEDRIGRGRGLTTSELAVLLATTKLALRSDILASDLPDEPFLADELRAYFAPVLRERFAAQIATHPLRREIVASLVANEVLNREDICYVFRSGDRAGVRGREVVCAYLVARDLLGMRDLWRGLDDVGRAIPARVRVDMLQRWNTVIEWLTDRLMRRGDGIDVVATVARYAGPVSALIEALPDTLVPADRETYDQDLVDLESHGVPAGLASRAAGAPYLMAVLDIADLSLTTGRDALDVAHQYAELAHLTNMGWLRDQLRALPGASHWEAMARTVLQEDLYDVQRRATGALLASSGVTGPEDVVRWLEETATPMQRPVLLVGELRGTGADAATLGLALRELKSGVDALSPSASSDRDR